MKFIDVKPTPAKPASRSITACAGPPYSTSSAGSQARAYFCSDVNAAGVRRRCGTAAWPSRAAARTAIFDFVESWYNLHRLHSSLGYRGPAEYEAALAA
jgi:transposase InsO family protein